MLSVTPRWHVCQRILVWSSQRELHVPPSAARHHDGMGTPSPWVDVGTESGNRTPSADRRRRYRPDGLPGPNSVCDAFKNVEFPANSNVPPTAVRRDPSGNRTPASRMRPSRPPARRTGRSGVDEIRTRNPLIDSQALCTFGATTPLCEPPKGCRGGLASPNEGRRVAARHFPRTTSCVATHTPPYPSVRSPTSPLGAGRGCVPHVHYGPASAAPVVLPSA